MTTAIAEVGVETANDLLKNWQGHRRLTRRVIEAFPEDKLFEFSIGGMRPFSELPSPSPLLLLSPHRREQRHSRCRHAHHRRAYSYDFRVVRRESFT